MEFDWDEEKRQSNVRKHGIDFRDAAEIFEGVTVMVEDDRFEAVIGGFLAGYCEQTEDLVAFRNVTDDALLIVEGRCQLPFERDFASSDLKIPEVLKGELFADVIDDLSRRGGWCIHVGRRGCWR